MKVPKKLRLLEDGWFYAHPPFYLKALFLSYVRGDLLILVPFVILLLPLAYFSWRIALLFFLLFFVLRHLGEMIYWLLKQMGNKEYRPPDGGFKKLGNEAVYILYQLISLVKAVVYLGLLILFLKGWR